MSVLTRKLFRDLWRLAGQGVTIAAVVACGIASYVAMQSCEVALRGSMDAYYARQRFGDVFAHVERAPDALANRLEALPGVAEVYPRVVELVNMPLPDVDVPPICAIVSLPRDGVPRLNGVELSEGRLPDPARADEALLLERFANSYDLHPGDTVPVVIEGNLRTVRIVGLANSPEYIYATPPGAVMPGRDDERFAVLWMGRDAVAAAFQIEGAFNDVVLRLQPGASERGVVDAVDRILASRGGFGAYVRYDHPSHSILRQELGQLSGMATVIPTMFLGVAAFLLNVVLSRLVNLQRGEIAVMKAVGYSNATIALHFLELVSMVVLAGAAIGSALGAWLGRGLTGVYAGVFGFPLLAWSMPGSTLAYAILASLAAALVGSGAALWNVVRLPPAEAMRPPAPARYRRTIIDAFGDWLPVPARLVLREVSRRPGRTALSSIGIAMAVGILVVGRFMTDAIDDLIASQFERGERDDVSVSFTSPMPERAVRSLAHEPGVEYAEGVRDVGARLRVAQRTRDIVVHGYPRDLKLRQILDERGEVLPIPDGGMLLSSIAAKVLELRVGDTVAVEFLTEGRPVRPVRIAGLVDDFVGLQGIVELGELRHLLREGPVFTMALLSVDPRARASVLGRLDDYPAVGDVVLHETLIVQFRRQMDEWMTTMTLVLTLFASTIAIGVVYNNARVALETRNRDLASLRVLGFTRGEIAFLLLGEMALQVGLAIPLGLWFGHVLSIAVSTTIDPERFRFPIVASSRTQAFAVIVVVIAGVISAALMRRKLDKLDLIAVLKTRE